MSGNHVIVSEVDAELDAIASKDTAPLAVYHQAAVVPTVAPPNEWSDTRIKLLARTFAAGATEDEFKLFLGTCQRLQLSPEARQIFSVERWDRDHGKVRQTMVSIDGLRLIAERTGQYRGQTPVEWCGKDGVWKDIWLDDAPPFAARVGVFRAGFAAPLYRTAKWSAFVQTVKGGGPNTMWRTKGDHMLGKCAESNALRAAFPQECSGVYTTDEMGQASNGQDDEPAPRRALPEAGPKQYVENNPPKVMAKVVDEAVAKDVPQIEVPRLIGKAYKDKHVLIDTLKSDDEVINYVRSLMHAKEADAAGKGKWQEYWTVQIAKAVDWAQSVRSIRNFSQSKADRAQQLKAAVAGDDAQEVSEDMYFCVHPDRDVLGDLDIRKWTNPEQLIDYRDWLVKTWAQPTASARASLVEKRYRDLMDEEAKLADQALSA